MFMEGAVYSEVWNYDFVKFEGILERVVGCYKLRSWVNEFLLSGYRWLVLS